MPESENALWAKTRRRNMAANRRRTERSESAAEPPAPPTSRSAPGVHPAAPFFVHRLCAPAGAKRRAPPGAPFLKGHHKFALWNDTIALRLKKTGRAAFPTIGAAKTAYARQHPCARQKPPRRAPICGRLLEKNKRGKTPRPNSWTEASAPAANRAERERRPRKRKAKTRAFAIDKPPCNRL